MKKFLGIILSFSICLSSMFFVSCGCEHEWVDASCAQPKVCKLCGETEGEVLEHVWKDATCEYPKTCQNCQTTEGEALNHDFAEANFQQPATCKVCGHKEGESLVPGYAASTIEVHKTELNKEFDFTTETYSNPDVETVGKVTIVEHETFESADGFEGLEGYEWRKVVLETKYGDENAVRWGFRSYMIYGDDYYEPSVGASSTSDEKSFSVNYNGSEFDKCSHSCAVSGGKWEADICATYYTFYLRLPVEYDGYIFGILSGDTEPEENKYLWEYAGKNTLLFRVTPTIK